MQQKPETYAKIAGHVSGKSRTRMQQRLHTVYPLNSLFAPVGPNEYFQPSTPNFQHYICTGNACIAPSFSIINYQ
jgi:hypothetical protein